MGSHPSLKIILFSALSVALSVTTVFLAPLPLLILRRNQGRNAFFAAAALGLVSMAFLVPLTVTISYLTAVVLAGVLSECENQGIGYSSSVCVTVLVLAGTGFLIGSFATHSLGFHPVTFFREQITQSLGQIKMPTDMALDKESLLKQVPSALVMLLIFVTWVNSVLTPRFERVLGWIPSKQRHFFSQEEFLQWRLPDAFVWVALASAAGYFFDFEPSWLKWTCTNIFNAVIMLYFFQGLAVVVSFFNAKKIGPIWRMLSYLLIFTQLLFIPVAVLGFVDLWMEFRKKANTDKSAVA